MQKTDYLNALGIDVWLPKNSKLTEQANAVDQALGETKLSTPAIENWSELQCTISQCTACDLHKTRTQTVFGIGNENADLMIIGEAPGAHEDQQGEPFVGRAGQLLTQMIQAIGFERKDVFISNILKCRPPGNRDPLPNEINSCTAFLLQQIHHIQPKVICAVGRIAAHHLLATDLSLGRLRRNTHYYGETRTPLLVTYHPAYLLRNPSAKAQAYEDLLRLQELATSL